MVVKGARSAPFFFSKQFSFQYFISKLVDIELTFGYGARPPNVYNDTNIVKFYQRMLEKVTLSRIILVCYLNLKVKGHQEDLSFSYTSE